MYYRYKTKGKSGNLLKYIFLGILISVLFVILFKYKEDLMFWKYSLNRISGEIQEFADAKQTDVKDAEVLLKRIQEYVEENPLYEDAYYLSARMHTLVGEQKSNINFTQFIMDSGSRLQSESLVHFYDALKRIKKGNALNERAARSDATLLLLARLYLYTGYSSEAQMQELMRDIAAPEEIENVEDRRLYGFLKVKSGEIEYGTEYISRLGNIETVEDRLFLAGVYKESQQYTDAIVTYKNILGDKIEKKHERTARYALGEIYFAQSLYSEALEQFSLLLLDEPENPSIKQYMAKTYRKLGDDKAAETYL